MSMQIEFKDEYNETTYYFGTVKEPELSTHGECNFTVVVAKFSNAKNWVINEINWSEEPKEKDKAEKRISDMVHEWHDKKCDIHMVIEPKDKDNVISLDEYAEDIDLQAFAQGRKSSQDPGDENE